MKRCGYCGRENSENAAWCQGCGTKFEQPPRIEKDEADPFEGLERIVTLDTEVQAGLIDAVLSDRKIPHIMQTYHDSAYDGLFQLQKGWGVLLAPPEFRAEILAVIEDVKQQSSSSASTESGAEESSS